METGEVRPGEDRRGGGDLIRGGSELSGGRGLMKEDQFHFGTEKTDEGMRISCHNEKKRCRSLSLLSFRLSPITSMSLTRLLTKVFIGLYSINYHPISKSHRTAALLLQHSVNSGHLVGADTFKFAHFFKLTLMEFKKPVWTKDLVAG